MTNVMGQLSKLRFALKNVNSAKDGETPIVDMGRLLEKKEKSLVLVGRCSNTIID